MNLEAVLQLSLAFTRVMGHEIATSVLISSRSQIFCLGDIENISLSFSGACGVQKLGGNALLTVFTVPISFPLSFRPA